MGSAESTASTTTQSRRNVVAPHALKLPIYTKLSSKRVVLASASPRRKEILEAFGLRPEIVKSEFNEDLDHGDFEGLVDDDPSDKGRRYACATATEKALEVYKRLVLKHPEDSPDLVIGADTIVLLPSTPGSGLSSQILEKPTDAKDNLRMLLDLQNHSVTSLVGTSEDSGSFHVITGVVCIYPCVKSPGFKVKEMAEVTKVWFGDVGIRTLEAYVDSKEGLDRAGGFAVQGLGGHLIRRMDGDWNNVVGFPGYAFFQFLQSIMKEDSDFLAD